MTLIVPNDGPSAPWIAATDVALQPGCAGIDDMILQESAEMASDVLYRLSGRQYTGAAGPVTVRPLCRPVDADDSFWSAFNFGMGIYAFGACAGGHGGNIASHYGCSHPPEVDLGVFPVTEIVEVLIDGVVIPADEYQLQDYRKLVRMVPTENAVPTERYGWPTSQRFDLPDTELNTFSVTYMYGKPPPTGGVKAAKTLAAFLAKGSSGDTNILPVRTTSVSRQGVTMQTVDVEDILAKGLTGIYTVDLWILSVNPGGQKSKTTVYSPDMGRARRMPRGVS